MTGADENASSVLVLALLANELTSEHRDGRCIARPRCRTIGCIMGPMLVSCRPAFLSLLRLSSSGWDTSYTRDQSPAATYLKIALPNIR